MNEMAPAEEFEQGRQAPFTMLGDWVAVSGVDPNARSLYWDVKAHVNENRGTGKAWPPREFLAMLAGDKQARTLDPYMRQLEAIDAIGAQRERSVAKMRSRNLYKVHDTPPRGWDGPSSHAEVWQWHREDKDACQEYYRDRKAWLKDIEDAWNRVKQDEKARGAKPSAPVSKEGHRAWLKECRRLWSARRKGKPSSPGSAVQRTTEPAAGAGEDQAQDPGSAVQRTTQCGTAHPGSAVERTGTTSKGNKRKGDAASPRSGADGRRPSDRSSAREVESGSAASSNDHPTSTDSPRPQAASKKNSSKANHTREQLNLVRAVRAHYPPDLLAAPLPDVPMLSQAILDALAGDVPAADRTVEQLGARIQQRWNHHGWASKFYAGEIDSLVGAAVAMVRPLKSTDRYGCGNPRCEAGKDVDTGVECHVCPERLAARRKARRNGETQLPGPRPEDTGQEWWECEIPTCRKPGSGPRPTSSLCPDCEAQLEAAAAALMAGPQAVDPQPEPAIAPAEDIQDDGADEETARLCAFYARQYGTPEQVEAYCTEAPF